jgi:transposase
MRGRTERQAVMLLNVTAEDFIPEDHPIRRVRNLIDPMLERLSPQLADLYAESGRHSVPPEHLIKATLLMALYSIRSERQFCERLRYDLLFKWFLQVNITDAPFNHSTFSKNRKRLIEQETAQALLGEVVREARRRRLISEEHFTVDGTLLQAWASLKSLRPRDGEAPEGHGRRGRNPSVDYHGERRNNETHVSKTDPQARLARKGFSQETRLCFGEHLLMENRYGLVVDVLVTQATGRAEREAALVMLDPPQAGGDGLRSAPTRGTTCGSLSLTCAREG